MYNKYKDLVQRLKELGPLISTSNKLIDGFSQITRETNRLVEIMDIQDELGIVDSVLATQKDVLQKLLQQIHKKGRGDRKAKTQKGDGSATAKDAIQTAALRDPARIQEAVRIVEDNIRAVAEMIGSAKRVQDDVGRAFWGKHTAADESHTAQTTTRLQTTAVERLGGEIFEEVGGAGSEAEQCK